MRDWRTKGRHTGYEDGKVEFDDSPHAAVDRLPHAIRTDGGNVKGGKAEDRGDADARDRGSNINKNSLRSHKVEERSESKDSTKMKKDIQNAEAENGAQGHAISSGNFQTVDDEQRQGDDKEVRANVITRITVPEFGKIDTGSVRAHLVVREAHGGTLEDRGHDAGDSKAEDNAADGPAGDLKPADDIEDTEV